MNPTEYYEKRYQHYLDEGYFSEWANQKALNDVKDAAEIIHKPSMVYIPGVGECAYTGD